TTLEAIMLEMTRAVTKNAVTMVRFLVVLYKVLIVFVLKGYDMFGWCGAQAFHPKEDNAAGLLIFDSHSVSNIILGLLRRRQSRPDCPGRLRSYIMR
ncbi:MAG: hypothetical protein IKA47_10710, partial [Oscillospiraceae bacterium]|nr:hypothetical protein [Oscillospiraceae bacterium]